MSSTPPDPEGLVPAPKPALSLVTANTRRSDSIFSRRGSEREANMPRFISSIMSARRDEKRSTISGPLPESARFPYPVEPRRTTLQCLTTPGSQETGSRSASTQLVVERVPNRASTPLSTAALEHSAVETSVAALRRVAETRVGAWVQGITKTDMTYQLKLPAIETFAVKRRVKSGIEPTAVSKERNAGHIAEQLQLTKPVCVNVRSEQKATVVDIRATKTTGQSYPLSSSSGGSTEQSTNTSGSDHEHSSHTSVESLPREICLVSPCGTLSEYTAPSKFTPSLYDPAHAGVFSSAANFVPLGVAHKPLPLVPAPAKRLECQRSYSSLPETRSPSPAFLARVASNESIYDDALTRPSSAQSFGSRTIRSSRSRHDFDRFDLEFQQTRPQLPIPTGGPPHWASSPSLGNAFSPDRAEAFQVRPLIIARHATPAIIEDEITALPQIRVAASPISPSPVIPRRSSKRGKSLGPRNFVPRERLARQNLWSTEMLTETLVTETFFTPPSRCPASTFLTIPSFSHPEPTSLSPIGEVSARLSILFPSENEDDCHRLRVEAAKGALLYLMRSLDSIEDLKSLASMDRGTLQVYKENEFSLLRHVLKAQCLPAWELQEWMAPAGSPTEDNVQSGDAAIYKRQIAQNQSIVDKLKVEILGKCSSFLRPETVSALRSLTAKESARVDRALFRIWCFCTIFSVEKRREGDLDDQMDWLRGGVIADNQQDCTATITDHSQFDFSSVLLMPPDHFGICNKGGIPADELYDMIELWNCLTVLLQNYAIAIENAGAYGVIDEAQPGEDDETARNTSCRMLEGWVFHLLALGPVAILALAELSDNVEAGFLLAKNCGWTDWNRNNVHLGSFLREPLCRLYQEHVAANPTTSGLGAAERQRREVARERTKHLQDEIRAARCRSYYQRLSFIDMSRERPMSTLTRTPSAASDRTLVDCSGLAVLSKTTSNSSPMQTEPPMPNWHQPRPRGALQFRSASPLLEADNEEWDTQEMDGLSTDFVSASRNPSWPVLNEVVLAGFHVTEAREALRVTWDAYRGFQPNAAVNWLVERTRIDCE